MTSGVLEQSRGVTLALAAVVALVLAWRVVVTGVDALPAASDSVATSATSSPAEAPDPEATWRKRLARNPADYDALLALAMQLQRDGKNDAARDAAAQVLRLAPNQQGALLQTGYLYLGIGDEASGLAVFKRFVELYPDQLGQVLPVFTTALDSGQHADFFNRAAGENPAWWTGFMQHACASAKPGGIQQAFTARLSAGLATVDERRCVIARLQREGQWTAAHQLWLNSLPPAQLERVGFVFNGGFESPLSNLGFDWMVPTQEGVVVAPELTQGASGRRALHVTFVNKRYSSPPIYEYLMLAPGRYRFDGRGRADGLSSWLGLQWGLYCHDAKGGEARQLARSDPLLGTSDWLYFQHDFAVGKDCPVQILRLELANAQRDAKSAGNVAVRLRGSLWYDDLRVSTLDQSRAPLVR